MRGVRRIFTTMTISEAEHILDILRSALESSDCSRLKAYDLFQIDTALKLRIANEYLFLRRKDTFEEQFASGLKLYGGMPFKLGLLFDEFNPIDSSTMDFKDKRVAALETASSFGDYCRSIRPEDPDYWKKIYARIGLEYDIGMTSPSDADYNQESAVPLEQKNNKKKWWQFWK